MMRSLEGENSMSTCILTGAGSGIGKAVALELSKRKYFDSFALIGRNEQELTRTINKMSEINNCKISSYIIDLCDIEKIPQLIETIKTEHKQINCLLNIAGYTDPQPLLSTSLDSIYTTYKVNVIAPMILMRECARYMKICGGKMLNVASTAGTTPRPGWVTYASSKAAVISMSQTLTEELAEYGIKVYCVSPGRCATKLRKRLAPDEDPSTIMQPQEVANVICNLVSDEEECLDGQNIIIR